MAAEPPVDTGVLQMGVGIRTRLLNRALGRHTVKDAAVDTQVLEAKVHGTQRTTVTSRIVSLPCETQARLDIISQGQVHSTTRGYSAQAVINSRGHHNFTITKPAYFDGLHVLTRPAYGSIHATNQPQAVHSIASGLPLLGPLGDQIAWSEVVRRNPQTEAVVVRQVADDVIPEVNQTVDRELTELNQQLRGLRQSLRNLIPTDGYHWRARSTANHVEVLSVAAMSGAGSASVASGSETPLTPGAEEDVAIVVSEQLVNQLLGSLPIGGLDVTDTELQKLLTADALNPEALSAEGLAAMVAAFTGSAGTGIANREASEAVLFSVRLDNEQPVQIRFRDGRVSLNVRFQVVPRLGAVSATQQLTIDLQGQESGKDMWSIQVADVTVQPVDSQQADMWSQLIGTQASQLLQSIPTAELSRRVPVHQFEPDMPDLQLYRITAEAGLLRVSLRSLEVLPVACDSL